MNRHPRPLLATSTLLVALAAGACASAPGPAGEPPPGAAVTGTITLADGVPMAYESRGAGETAVVFVHCWACNREFWHGQVGAVADAGYRVVRLDLPGHGESGSGRSEWSVGRLGADVAAAIEAMDLDRVVLVGHSMGGPVSVEAAARAPERVVGIVCVDTLHDAELEWPEGMAESIAGQLEADYRGGLEAFVPRMFLADADPALVEWVVDQGVETSDHAATIALMRAMGDWDPRERLPAAGVPIFCVNAAPAGEQGLPTRVGTNRKYADYEAVTIEGVGHYLQLDKPWELNQALLSALRALDGLTGRR